jgi:hypothetical protein
MKKTIALKCFFACICQSANPSTNQTIKEDERETERESDKGKNFLKAF